MSISKDLLCGKDCENRKPGCHDICEKYQEHRRQRAEINAKKTKEAEDYYIIGRKLRGLK